VGRAFLPASLKFNNFSQDQDSPNPAYSSSFPEPALPPLPNAALL
jgi:hypothetical protein